MTIITATGVSGHLIWCGDGVYRFRVYTPTFEELLFTDYDLTHSDLCVTITDKDAAFYLDNNGERLDHSPETLGIKND